MGAACGIGGTDVPGAEVVVRGRPVVGVDGGTVVGAVPVVEVTVASGAVETAVDAGSPTDEQEAVTRAKQTAARIERCLTRGSLPHSIIHLGAVLHKPRSMSPPVSPMHMVGKSHDDDVRTARALRLTAGAFGALAVALMAFAIRDLATGREAGESILGIAYLAITAVVMFGLAIAKRRTADALGSAPLRSEAAMTFLDGVLSTVTLIGLALNAFVGWWWADPLAALLVGIAAAREAQEVWSEAAEYD
jgi:hypothetical protein